MADRGSSDFGYPRELVSLAPPGPAKGAVLIAYVLEPFLLAKGQAVSSGHTHHQESVLMARVWLEAGFNVDVIDYRFHDFRPTRNYDFFVSARIHLERLAKLLGGGTRKIAHLDTSHFAVNNAAAYERLVALQNRRGVSLPGSIRLIEVNRGIEAADTGVVLGNEVTASTYAYAAKPLRPLPVPAIQLLPWDEARFRKPASRNFVWLGSNGLVHKGLDLVLEAFAGLPGLNLTICGPLDGEPQFVDHYRRELTMLPNVQTIGWVDVAGPLFRDIVNTSSALIYPSCGEGQAGAVVNSVCGGLVPIISRASGVSVGDFGTLLQGCDVQTLRDAVTQHAGRPESELRDRMRAAWEYGRENHIAEAYVREYAAIVNELVEP
jgi:glycosyltransferase involved in cell wall biosynthesis